MKPQAIGTIGVTRARLFDSKNKLIGYCLDTPNAIAKAFIECHQAQSAQGILGTENRAHYQERMQDWNIAHSNLEVIK